MPHEPKKSPQAKKILDYKHQKRTNWDSDKAARKAIPAAKRRKNKGIRKSANELLHVAKKVSSLGTEELDDIASNRGVSRPMRSMLSNKYSTPLSLAENIERQRKRREQAKGNYSSDYLGRLTPEVVSRKCTSKSVTKLIQYMQCIEAWRTGQGLYRSGNRNMGLFSEKLDEVKQFSESRLIQEFWAKEPGWRTKFDYWVDWRQRHMQDGAQNP
jgi:hypothetical protein